MKKIFNKKVLIALSIIGIICILLSSSVFAVGEIWEDGRNFIKAGSDNGTPIGFEGVWKELKPIAQVVMGIGLVVLVCVGTILGVKYMIAGADEKAKVKQKLIWFCVAAALVVAATGIFNIVVQVAEKFD